MKVIGRLLVSALGFSLAIGLATAALAYAVEIRWGVAPAGGGPPPDDRGAGKERNSTSPRAVAAGEEAVAGLVVEALVALVALAGPAGLAAEAALPGVPAGQVEPGPLVERAVTLGPAPLEVVARAGLAAGRAPAAVGPALLRGRPELVAGPGLAG
jgi:hypothetical protein